jgi:PIN domain nuclease of toxin-antitoxin system
VKHLLDTHAFLWFVLDDPRLSAVARSALEKPADVVVLSPASLWEIAIKISIGKYQLNRSFDEFCQKAIHESGIEMLPIEQRHLGKLISLPFLHRDPFDRLLVA